MKVLDIASKDLLRSFRSLFAVGMTFVAPLLITGLIYFAFGGLSQGAGRFDLPTLKVAIVNLDQPQSDLQLGKLIVDSMHDERMPGWLQVSEIADEAAARAALDRQEAGVVVLIPRDLTASALSPAGSAAITVIHDPTLTFGPAFVKDVLGLFLDGVNGGKIALTVVSEQVTAQGGQLDAAAQQAMFQQYSAWYTALQQDLRHGDDPVLAVQAPSVSGGGAATSDPTANIVGQIMAGMLIFFAFYTGAYTAMSILQEDEEGTLARLFTTPTPRSVILGGKFVSVFITVAVQAVVLMTASALAFKVRWGQPLSVTLATLGLIVAASGFGLFVLSFIKSTRQGGPILGGALTLTGMLGGLFTGTMSMPAAFNTITLLMPQGWAMRALKLALSGGGTGEVLLPVIVLLGMGVVFFAIGVSMFRKRFA